ncbi:MAG TPA: hypothetical protein PK760_03635, partial [Flavobacteriales bacterium]|nr:hypothetical protein [Flavobacteriales bacterium]
MRVLSNVLVLAFTLCVGQGALAQSCFLSVDFEDGNFPSGWSNTTVAVIGSTETTDAWRVGNADSANTNSYFPVADVPLGNKFIMANDDASPCDCDMADVYFTSPVVDLSGRTNVALECRVFHEMILGGGVALIEASTDGAAWATVDTIMPLLGHWRNVLVDLSAYVGASAFQLRYHWSDSSNWASGIAVDDICLYERLATDVRVVDVRLHPASSNPFLLDIADMRYTMLPLEQARPLVVSVIISNRGSNAVNGIDATATIQLAGNGQGSFTSSNTIALEPGARDTIDILTGWTANSVGLLEVSVDVPIGGSDGDPSDNTGTASMRITGPGWDDLYGAMALDDGHAQGAIGGNFYFIAANRMEITAEGSTAHGASAVLGATSNAGQPVRAILLDANLTFIDTSSRHILTDWDIQLSQGNGAIYLPFVHAPALSPGDYFVGMQHLADSGNVTVMTSGECVPGASAIISGSILDVDWLQATPMVRLHLSDYGVGVSEQVMPAHKPRIFPNPADGTAFVTVEAGGDTRATIEIFDELGALVRSVPYVSTGPGAKTIPLDISDLPNAAYSVVVRSSTA